MVFTAILALFAVVFATIGQVVLAWVCGVLAAIRFVLFLLSVIVRVVARDL